MPSSIIMCHETATGEDDSVLTSLLTEGIKIRPGYVPFSNQKSGFFVNNRYGDEKKTVEEGIKTERPGRPLLITVKCEFGAGFDLDYEDNPALSKAILFNFQDTLRNVPADVLQLRDGSTIHSITPVEEGGKEGLNIELQKDGLVTTLFLSWDKTKTNRSDSPSTPELLQLMRDYLVSTLGSNYLMEEEQKILEAIEQDNEGGYLSSKGISMKSHGSKAPEILKLEVWNGKSWEDIPIPEKASGWAKDPDE